MEQFHSLKNKAIQIAKDCEKLSDACNCTEQSSAFKKIRKTLSVNKIAIMAVGEARTGKSSLLGAYLDDNDLFPVDADVTTCLITMAAYGEKEKITVVLRDDDHQEKTVEIQRNQIADYAKEQNNPNGEKKATMILIETPNSVLKEGFIFIDTPGIGSLNPLHSQLTYSFLPRADVVFFISDASSQISTSELAFLKNVAGICSNLLFVLTKKDLQYDCEELILQNKKAVFKETGIGPDQQVWIPVSSRLLAAYKRTQEQTYLDESGFALLDHEITAMLTARRSQIVILPRLMEIKYELELTGQVISSQETAYSGNADAVQKKEAELTALFQKKQSVSDNLANLDYEIKSCMSDVESNLTAMLDEYSKETADYIEGCLQKKEYSSNPMMLKSEIIARTEQEIIRIQQYASDAIDRIQFDLCEKIGVNFDFDSQELNLSPGREDQIQFRKNTKYQQVVQAGQDIRKNSFALNAVGGIVGGVAGGIAGFAAGGPFGAAVGVTTGADLGKNIGNIIGTSKSVVDVVMHGTSYNAAETKKELNAYVASCLKNWNRSKQKFTSDAVNVTKNTIRKRLNADLSALNQHIMVLKESKKTAGTELAKARKQIEALRNSYDKLYRSLEDLTIACTASAALPDAEDSQA